MKKIKKFISYYIIGEYHCDTCPFCWSEKTSYEYDEWDCGCYIKGEIADNACRLLPPVRFVIGSIKKKKATYYFNHQYDNYAEFIEKQEKHQDKLEKLILDDVYMYRKELYAKNCEGDYILVDKEELLNNVWRIQSNYEDFAHPLVRKKLRTQWKELMVLTIKSVTNKIKPYFCK